MSTPGSISPRHGPEVLDVENMSVMSLQLGRCTKAYSAVGLNDGGHGRGAWTRGSCVSYFIPSKERRLGPDSSFTAAVKYPNVNLTSRCRHVDTHWRWPGPAQFHDHFLSGRSSDTSSLLPLSNNLSVGVTFSGHSNTDHGTSKMIRCRDYHGVAIQYVLVTWHSN